MTNVLNVQIPQPFAWTGADLGGKAPLVREANSAVLEALDDLAIRLRGRPIGTITRQDAEHPAVDALMQAVRSEVMQGRGISVLTGLDPARWDPADYERIYWALGTHLGQGVVQSAFGDYVARVERNPDLPWRGTTTDMELRPHTDFHEVMSLASISTAPSGGVSGFVSALAVHNEILLTRPDLLPALYDGWFNVSILDRTPSVRKVPIFCCVEGKVSCFYNRVFFQPPEDAGAPIPPDLIEGMALIDEIVMRPGFRAEFTLEPGEAVFWHNFLVMHARSAFQDAADRRRLLLRLWLNVPDGRPMDPEFRERARVIDADHLAGRRTGLA